MEQTTQMCPSPEMELALMRVYEELFKAYSQQNWWPVTEKNEITPSYKKRSKLTEKQVLEVCIGAILTQNTNWKPNVVTAIENLNRENLINLEKLKRIEDKKLASLIKSSGYYNQKAERLKLFAKFLHEHPIRELQEMDAVKLRELLLSQKGIGEETADSIVLYAFGKPVFVVDAYTRRIFSRLEILDENDSYGEIQELFHSNLERNPALFNEFHALIVEHAKSFCKKNPECSECPLKKMCK